MLIFIRNGLAFTYAWLVLCVAIVSLIFKNSSISVLFKTSCALRCRGDMFYTLLFESEDAEKRIHLFSDCILCGIYSS